MSLASVPRSGGVFKVEDRAGLVCCWWQGEPGEVDNNLLVLPGFSGRIAEALKSAEPFVAASQSPTVLRVLDTEQYAGEIDVIERQGYAWSGSSPVMAAELTRARLPRVGVAGARVTAVTTQEEYGAVVAVIDRVFGGPAALTRFFNPFGRVRIYAAFVDGRPVASATLRAAAGVAGVYSVTTLPEYRRRGLALAVLGALLADQTAAGTRLASLRTEDNLVRLYRRLGFEVVGRVARYARPAGPVLRTRVAS